MGRRPGFLALGKRRDCGRNHPGSSAQAEHVLHLARRETREFRFPSQYCLPGGRARQRGLPYRSIERTDVAKWVMEGYQADIDAQQTYTGQLYEERDRGFLALRGMLAYAPDGKKPGTLGAVGDSDQLKGYIKNEDWNDMQVIARGNSLVHLWNGHLMCVFLDDDAAHRRQEGLIGIQLHVTKTGMKIETRNVRIKMF